MLFQGFHPTTTTNTTSSLSAQWTKLLLNFHLLLSTWEQRARRMSPIRMMRRTRTEMIAMKIQTNGVTWRKNLLVGAWVSGELFKWQSLCEYQEGSNVYFGLVWSDLPIWMPQTFYTTLHHIQKMGWPIASFQRNKKKVKTNFSNVSCD